MIQQRKSVTPILKLPRLPLIEVPRIQARTPPLFAADITDVDYDFTAGVQESQDDPTPEIGDTNPRVTQTPADGSTPDTGTYPSAFFC